MVLTIQDDLFDPLIELADQFSCTIEMVAYLSILKLGGPKRLFLWYYDAHGQIAGTGNIPTSFQSSLFPCTDDLELALLLTRAWFQSGSTNEKRKLWAKNWQINHEALLYSVDSERDRLLANRFYNKSDEETVRPIDLRLLPKVRLLIAYHLVSIERARSQPEKGLVAKVGISSIYQQKPSIHADSLYYRRDAALKAFLYFFPDQEWEQLEAITAQQVIALAPSWLSWLREKERDTYDLAYYIANQTRVENKVEISHNWERSRIFLNMYTNELLKSFVTTRVSSGKYEERIIEEPKYGKHGILGDIRLPFMENSLHTLQVDEKFEATITYIPPGKRDHIHVEITPGRHGILEAKEFWGSNEIHGENISLYEKIVVRVKSIDTLRNKIYLTARIPENNPYAQPTDGQITTGIVAEVTPTDAFITIHPDIKIVRCRFTSYLVPDLRTILKPGQEVTVHIQSVSPETQEITASIPLPEFDA